MRDQQVEPSPSPDPWWTTARVVVSRLVLAVGAGLAVWPLVFALLGFTTGAISSGSMMPNIRVGDVVASSPMDFADVQPGQIVTVHNPATDDGSLLTHRVHAIADDGALITKGDANADVDSTPVPEGDVWLGRLRVPFVGYPVVWLDAGAWIPLASTAVALVVLARTASERPFVSPAGRRGSVRAPVVATTAAVVALAVVVVAAGGPTSSAAFTSVSSAAVSTWAVAASRLGPYGDAVLADAPFLFFRMDEQSGDVVVDSSGHGHDSSYRGNPDRDVVGALPGQTPINSATDFNGVAAIASSRTYANTTSFTFEAFLKSQDWRDNTEAATIAELRTATGFADRLLIKWGSLYYQADENSEPVHLQGYVATNDQWAYVAMSLSGTTMRVSMDRYAWDVNVPARTPVVDARFVIGTHLQPFADPTALGVDNYRGVMDEVALYQRALTPAQITAHIDASGLFPQP